jgi:hypothetical protein
VGRRINPSEEDFGDLLRDGLSTSRTYVVLKEKNRSPVYLCFRPFISRMGMTVVYVGGKLSAFPNTSHEKWANMDEEEQTEALKAGWKNLPQDRVSSGRVGSNAGFYVAAGGKDLEVFKTKFDKGHLIHVLLDSIEEQLETEVSNRQEVVAYLSGYYREHLEPVFGQGVSLPPRLVGKKSEILLGQGFLGNEEKLAAFMNQYGLSEVQMKSDAA